MLVEALRVRLARVRGEARARHPGRVEPGRGGPREVRHFMCYRCGLSTAVELTPWREVSEVSEAVVYWCRGLSSSKTVHLHEKFRKINMTFFFAFQKNMTYSRLIQQIREEPVSPSIVDRNSEFR